jgi:hypothetical protein
MVLENFSVLFVTHWVDKSDNLFYLKDGQQGFGTEEWEYTKDGVMVNFIIDSITVKFEYRVCKGCEFKPSGILCHVDW